MILVCRVCHQPRIVPGPRNEKRWSYCRPDGLLALAEEDLLTREEADELHQLLTPSLK